MSELKDYLFYQDDWATIYCGDCREILPMFEPVDLVLTDPPYGCGVVYGSSYSDDPSIYWDWFLPCLEMIKSKAKTLIFTHRNFAVQKITGQDWTGVWHKPCAMGARIGNSAILPHWEPIFFFGIHGQGVHVEYIPDVLSYVPEKANNNSYIGREKSKSIQFCNHPTPKPLSLWTRLVSTFSDSSSLICDPFMGSGTTLRAAKNLGRKSIGIEIEEKYCEIAVKRLRQEVFDFSCNK